MTENIGPMNRTAQCAAATNLDPNGQPHGEGPAGPLTVRCELDYHTEGDHVAHRPDGVEITWAAVAWPVDNPAPAPPPDDEPQPAPPEDDPTDAEVPAPDSTAAPDAPSPDGPPAP